MKSIVVLSAGLALASALSSAMAAPTLPAPEVEAQGTVTLQRVIVQGGHAVIETESTFVREREWSDQRPVTFGVTEPQSAFPIDASWSEQRPVTVGTPEPESNFTHEARWSDQRPLN